MCLEISSNGLKKKTAKTGNHWRNRDYQDWLEYEKRLGDLVDLLSLNLQGNTTVDCSLRNRKDTENCPEAQESYSTLINTSSTRARQNGKTLLLPGLTTWDMVPQSWVINCLKIYKISDEVIHFIEKNMKTRRVELIKGGKSLAEAKIHGGII